MRSDRILLFWLVFVVSMLGVSAYVQEWTQYGYQDEANNYFPVNIALYDSNTNISLSNSVAKGSGFQPLGVDIDGDGFTEVLIAEDGIGSLYAFDGNGSIERNYSVNAELLGHPIYFDDRYIGLFWDGSNVYFKAYNLNPTSDSFTTYRSTSLGTDRNQFYLESVACIFESSNYCVFADFYNNVYRYNLDTGSYITNSEFNDNTVDHPNNSTRIAYPHAPRTLSWSTNFASSGVVFASYGQAVPDGGTNKIPYVGVVDLSSFTAVAGGYSWLSETANTDGLYVVSPYNQSAVQPVFHDFDGGNDELFVVTGANEFDGEQIGVFKYPSDLIYFRDGSAQQNKVAQPFRTFCNVSGVPRSGIGIYTASEALSNEARFSFYYPNPSTGDVLRIGTAVQQVEGDNASTLTFEMGQQVVATDLTKDDVFEHIFVMEGTAGTNQKRAVIASCTDFTGSAGLDVLQTITTVNDWSSIVLGDFDNDETTDVVLSSASGTSYFSAQGGTAFAGTNEPPTIQNLNTSTLSSIINRSVPFWFTANVTDPEGDDTFMAVQCSVPEDSVSNFGSANIDSTIENACVSDTLGTFTAYVFATDNQFGTTDRTFSNTGSYEALLAEFPFESIQYTVAYYCGDSQCDVSETGVSCSADCPATCGDSVCQASESVSLCPIDCAVATCGNAICELTETFSSCPADCTISTCGDGLCSASETSNTCPYDCFTLGTCGDGVCSADETYASCSIDCSIITCGNNVCNSNEDGDSCPFDCFIVGDNLCETAKGETADNSADCQVSQQLSIPTSLVDIENGNLDTGLLPELYFGLLQFFGNSLVPILILSIFLMVAMVFILIANILKKLVDNG